MGVHKNQTTTGKMLKHQFHSHFQVRNSVSLKKRVIIKERKYQFISKKKHELPNHAQNSAWTCVVNSSPFQWKTIHNLRPREPVSKEEKKTVLKKKENMTGNLWRARITDSAKNKQILPNCKNNRLCWLIEGLNVFLKRLNHRYHYFVLNVTRFHPPSPHVYWVTLLT